MSNTNQNFEDSGGFGQEWNQKIMKMIYTINLSKMLKLKIVVYLNIQNSIGNLPMNDILKNPFKVKKLSNHIIKFE
jgi:hypothetical protein